MIAKAIIKDGGLFIPNVDLASLHSKQEVRIQFEVIDQLDEEDIFKKTAGMLKNRRIDPLKFQDEQREVAVGADALEILRRNGVIGCLHGGENLSETNEFFSEKENS
jgi:hypothetical protein